MAISRHRDLIAMLAQDFGQGRLQLFIIFDDQDAPAQPTHSI
jgi:hypothetical protein